MDALRAIQLLTDLAYLALGIAAVAAALRSHERARLDDVADVPPWQMWLALLFVIALAAAFIVGGALPPSWLVLLLTVYLVFGTAYAAWAFGRRAMSTRGITRRRMAAVAWGCG